VRAEGKVNDTDARLWHPWLRVNRVPTRDVAHALERGGVGEVKAEFKKALVLRSQILSRATAS
jgi:hypothetical protein